MSKNGAGGCKAVEQEYLGYTFQGQAYLRIEYLNHNSDFDQYNDVQFIDDMRYKIPPKGADRDIWLCNVSPQNQWVSKH